MAHHKTFGRGKGFTALNPQPPNDVVNTPVNIAKQMIDLYQLEGTVLDPCRGKGAFYNNFPKNVKKEWCEIKEGIDFFEYNKQVDWIISNPPFSILDDFFEHSFKLSKNVVFLIPLSKLFSSFYRIDNVLNYGKIVSIDIISAGKCGFPFGFPVCSVHIKEGYEGETLITKWRKVGLSQNSLSDWGVYNGN